MVWAADGFNRNPERGRGTGGALLPEPRPALWLGGLLSMYKLGCPAAQGAAALACISHKCSGTSTWRRHSCLPRRHSCRRFAFDTVSCPPTGVETSLDTADTSVCATPAGGVREMRAWAGGGQIGRA